MAGARIRRTYRELVPECRGLTRDGCQNARALPGTGARILRTCQNARDLPGTGARTPEVQPYRRHLPESGALTEDGCQNPEVFQSSFIPEADPHRQVTNHLPRADREYLLERICTKLVLIFRFKKIIFYPRKYWRRYSPFL